MVELQHQQSLMKSRPSNSRKKTTIEPRVAQANHAANVAHLTHPENAQHMAKNIISVEIKIILVHVVGQSKRASGMAKDHPMVGAQ